MRIPSLRVIYMHEKKFNITIHNIILYINATLFSLGFYHSVEK